jgi:hypothetical protein
VTTGRRAPAPITVTFAAIAAIRITVAILVIITPAAVTITAVAIVTTITVIAAVPTIVRVTMGRTAVSHVLPRGRSMRPISYGIVNSDPTAIQINAVQLINALRGFLDSAHTDKTKATRPVRPLVVDNGHFFNMPKPAEFLIEVTLSCANAQAKDTKHVARIRGNGGMRGAPRRRGSTL